MIRVETGSRLHFGLFNLGGGDTWPNVDGEPGVPARRFGGVGLMIAEPQIRLMIAAAHCIEAFGPLAGRAVEFARHVIADLQLPESTGCRIAIEAAPREHVGLAGLP